MRAEQVNGLPCSSINGSIRLADVRQALQHGDLRLEGQERHVRWLDEVAKVTQAQVRCHTTTACDSACLTCQALHLAS